MESKLQNKYAEFQQFVAAKVGEVLAITDTEQMLNQGPIKRAAIKCKCIADFSHEELAEIVTSFNLQLIHEKVKK